MQYNNTFLPKVITVSIVLFLILILVQSCTVYADSSEPMSFQKGTAKNGLVMGSITFPKEKARFNGYFIQISGKNADKKIAKRHSTEMPISPAQFLKMKHIGELDNGLTYVFAMERPIGEYSISGIRLFNNYGYLVKETFIKDFNIPFEVKKGEITYIGNILFDEELPINEHPVKLSKNLKRDVDAITKIQPGVDWRNAISKENISISYSKTR